MHVTCMYIKDMTVCMLTLQVYVPSSMARMTSGAILYEVRPLSSPVQDNNKSTQSRPHPPPIPRHTDIPEWGPNKGITRWSSRCWSKVCQFDHTLLCQQDIPSLDISMNAVVAMQICQTLEEKRWKWSPNYRVPTQCSLECFGDLIWGHLTPHVVSTLQCYYFWSLLQEPSNASS